jgi:hypothetical protein
VVTTVLAPVEPTASINVCRTQGQPEASDMTTRKRKQERDLERLVLLALTFGLGAAIWLIASGRLQF